MSVDQQSEPEHDGGALPRSVLFPLGALCFGILAQLWATQPVWGDLPLMAITSFVFLCYTSCFHESAHHTLSNSEWFSVIVGRCLGTLMYTPYSTYRESHIRHHACLNKPTDFELWPYSNPNAPLWFRWAFVWLNLLLEFITSLMVYGRTYLSKSSPIRKTEIRRTIAREYV
jgi:fatty acid desaturase